MNSIEVNNHEIFKVMKLAFENNQTFILRVRGTSMFPLLKDKKDSVRLAPINGELKKRDIVLYRRTNGAYVMHRIIKIKDGVYSMVGDNQRLIETPIYKEQILAIATHIIKNDKEVEIKKSKKYRFFGWFWCLSLFMRACILKIIRPLFLKKG
jgi:SOS-response transcriptional repressor LexA